MTEESPKKHTETPKPPKKSDSDNHTLNKEVAPEATPNPGPGKLRFDSKFCKEEKDQSNKT